MKIPDSKLENLGKGSYGKEPRNQFEFCDMFSKITGRSRGMFLKQTEGFPITWFLQVQSECKEKPKDTQAKIINAFVRDARAKEK